MILELKSSVSREVAHSLAHDLDAILVHTEERFLVVTPAAIKTVQPQHEADIDRVVICDSDIQLASRSYLDTRRTVAIGEATIGGNTRNTLLIAGPCSVESREQIHESARFLKSLGVHVFRAGCFKPRTSPYSFQGLGAEGLRLLDEVRSTYGLSIVTEVRDASHVDQVIEIADVIQIGAKAMYDHAVLKRCGKARKPVLLKRGFGSTLQEFVQAAEFILSGGNGQVVLCERGIRTFETKTRFTLDLCGAVYLKENTNLPVILDPSHAMGYSYGVPDLARACAAMGVSGLLIEVHPDPSIARSDAAQQLNHEQISSLIGHLREVTRAVGFQLI